MTVGEALRSLPDAPIEEGGKALDYSVQLVVDEAVPLTQLRSLFVAMREREIALWKVSMQTERAPGERWDRDIVLYLAEKNTWDDVVPVDWSQTWGALAGKTSEDYLPINPY